MTENGISATAISNLFVFCRDHRHFIMISQIMKKWSKKFPLHQNDGQFYRYEGGLEWVLGFHIF